MHRQNNPINQDSNGKTTNKYAAISKEIEQSLKEHAKSITNEQLGKLSEDEQEMWELILKANQLAQAIASVDLPDDNQNDDALILMVQNEADKILRDDSKSWLSKIIDIAAFSKKMGFGNCMEKAFFGFTAMLYLLNQYHFDKDTVPTLRLYYFENHFTVIVNDKFFMDPWLNLAFPLPEGHSMQTIQHVFEGFGNFVHYFSIDMDANCYTGGVRAHRASHHQKPVYDAHSSEYSRLRFDELQNRLRREGCFDLPPQTYSRKRKIAAISQEDTPAVAPLTPSPTLFSPAAKKPKLIEAATTLANGDLQPEKTDFHCTP